MAVAVNLSGAMRAKYSSGFDYSTGVNSVAATQARFSAPLTAQGPTAGMLNPAQFTPKASPTVPQSMRPAAPNALAMPGMPGMKY